MKKSLRWLLWLLILGLTAVAVTIAGAAWWGW
jgi:hypothetical protein